MTREMSSFVCLLLILVYFMEIDGVCMPSFILPSLSLLQPSQCQPSFLMSIFLQFTRFLVSWIAWQVSEDIRLGND